MVYAPVIIWTLNRFEHFKACFESLEACTGASCTDVLIALDYPPSEKYVEGWKKIDSFLHEKEKSNVFKQLIVFRRSYNFGIAHNGRYLIEEVKRRGYDRWIISEDDNVFSPNFLEYINKGLELYKNDKRVLAICGYKNDFECKISDNNHFAEHSLYQAWGVGILATRYREAQESLTPIYFRRIVYNHRKWRKCYKYWPHWFMSIVRNAMSSQSHLPRHDTNMGFYMINENKCVICPVVSKVRNMGWDALSTTTTLEKGNLRGRAEHEVHLKIDTEKSFEFKGNPFVYEEDNSYNIAMWDGQWETDRMRSLWRIYPRIWAFRILAFLGVI